MLLALLLFTKTVPSWAAIYRLLRCFIVAEFLSLLHLSVSLLHLSVS